MLPTIVPAKPPKRAKPARKLRPTPPCGTFVIAKSPKRAAALRTSSKVVEADPVPIRRSVGNTRKATSAEIQECLAFAGHHDPMMSKIAMERLLDHLQACGLVLMSKDDATQS